MGLREASLDPSTWPDEEIQDVYDDGYLRVEHKYYYVACGGECVRLPRTEFLILSRLARSMERTVSVEELWRGAWGASKPLNTESLHVYIYRIRNQLEPYNLRIETMINVGYRLLSESGLGQSALSNRGKVVGSRRRY